MSLRFWVGLWVMVALLVIVAFDLSALVRYITRFTEESFAVLISVIFIYEAFTKIAEIYHDSAVHTGVVREEPSFRCYCVPSVGIEGQFDVPYVGTTAVPGGGQSTVNSTEYGVFSNITGAT